MRKTNVRKFPYSDLLLSGTLITTDVSWGNDSCDSLLVVRKDRPKEICKVWIDSPDPSQRESGSFPRFAISALRYPNPPAVWTTENMTHFEDYASDESEWEGESQVALLERLGVVPFQDGITSREEALLFLEDLCLKLPDGFHGEDDLTTIGKLWDGLFVATFSHEEGARLEALRRACLPFCPDICQDLQEIAQMLGQAHAMPEEEE